MMTTTPGQPFVIDAETLDQMTSNPHQFPGWAIAQALKELRSFRAAGTPQPDYLGHFITAPSDDEVKTDLELTCTVCREVVCDVEADDPLRALCSTALAHLRAVHPELVDAPPAPEVLITPIDDPDEEGRFIGVALVCPHPDCHATDAIRERDKCERWNDVSYFHEPSELSDLRDGLLIDTSNDDNDYEGAGFFCESCERDVTLPADLLRDASYT